MTYNLRFDEGIYDAEASGCKASMFSNIFNDANPKAYYEARDTVVDSKKLEKFIKKNNFEVHYSNICRWEDGDERTNRILFHRESSSMMVITQTLYSTSTNKWDIDLDEDGELLPPHRKPNNNPNKFKSICFLSLDINRVMDFKKMIESIIIEEESKNKLFLLKQSDYGSLSLDSFPMDFSDMDLEINYGKKFLTPHGSIIKCLEEKKSGLYIFHGPPGTGKTSYIKYLTGQMDHKKFIFIPNTMISNIFSPKFVEKLYSFRNSVLVLEDAEICLFKRDGTNNELVSGILNITDGLLKDLLNISIIVTFNSAETRELDEALLRKGRLHFMHKFDLLSEEDAKLLAKKLNKKKDIAGPTSLADVYNLDESTGLEEEKAQTKVFGFAQR